MGKEDDVEELAQIYILLRVPFYIPDGTLLDPIAYQQGGFVVRLKQPAESKWRMDASRTSFGLQHLLPSSSRQLAAVTFNGTKTMVCDLLSLEVDAATEANIDSAIDAAFDVANRWLRTYRVGLGTHQVEFVGRSTNNWRAELISRRPGMIGTKTYGGVSIKVPPMPFITADAWSGIKGLGEIYVPERWEELLTDAMGLMPAIGPASVLAYAALEIRIDTLADILARKVGIDPIFWKWIRSRPYLAQFTTEEIAKKLFEIWAGGSLSQQSHLWAIFVELRKARNSFAHEGVPRNLAGQNLTIDAAATLLAGARQVLDWLDGLVPEEQRRPSLRLADKEHVEIPVGPLM